MHISDAIKNAKTFDELREIADKAKPVVSWLGYYYITCDGYSGKSYITDIFEKVFDIIKQDPDKYKKYSMDWIAPKYKLLKSFDNLVERTRRIFGKKISCSQIDKWNVDDSGKYVESKYLRRCDFSKTEYWFNYYQEHGSIPEKESPYIMQFVNHYPGG
jgi:hypothetical protein